VRVRSRGFLDHAIAAATLAALAGCYVSHRRGEERGGRDAGAGRVDARRPDDARLDPADGAGSDPSFRPVHLVGGYNRSCAIDARGAARCWGDDRYAQLGVGEPGAPFACDSREAPGPFRCATAPRPLAVGETRLFALGVHHGCGLRDAGLWCWGRDDRGKLGPGEARTARTPEPGANVGDIRALVAGWDFTCVLNVEGAVLCWGSNALGALGTSPMDRERHTEPSRVPLPAPATDLRAGHNHACALLEAGEVYCWGENVYGQLGISSSEARASATPVRWPEPATGILLGPSVSCATFAGGGVRCTEPFAAPTEDDPRFAGVSSLTWGWSFWCGVTDGSVVCAGDNRYGVLGRGSEERFSEGIARVALPGRAVEVVAGFSQVHALLEDGRVFGWGSDAFGEVGDGDGPLPECEPRNTCARTPVPVAF
jgi:hypothetical protein